MKTYPSLIGNRYGKLVVEEAMESDANGRRRWLCRCDCGGSCVATSVNLSRGKVTSCGCKKSPDLTGMVFGRLTVLGRSDMRNSRGARTTPMWECRCECGNITYKATDTLKNSDESMCIECNGKLGAENARKSAGFIGGTQVTKLVNLPPTVRSTTGYRGVYYDQRTKKYRARLKLRGKTMNFGSYTKLEDAVNARKAAEREYFEPLLEELGIAK